MFVSLYRIFRAFSTECATIHKNFTSARTNAPRFQEPGRVSAGCQAVAYRTMPPMMSARARSFFGFSFSLKIVTPKIVM